MRLHHSMIGLREFQLGVEAVVLTHIGSGNWGIPKKKGAQMTSMRGSTLRVREADSEGMASPFTDGVNWYVPGVESAVPLRVAFPPVVVPVRGLSAVSDPFSVISTLTGVPSGAAAPSTVIPVMDTT
jgi:hypothetical protein